MPDWLSDILASQFALSVLVMLVVLGILNGAIAYLILLERKVAAWTQDRCGPNRAGPLGLLQPIADGIKLILKENIIPGNVERALFVLAPCIALAVGLVGFAVIPFGGPLQWSADSPVLSVQAASIDIGLLYIAAVGSLGVYAVVLGGWASNNKYSFYGGLRAAAQMLSYEVPLGLCLLVCVLTTGQLRLEEMVQRQIASAWTGLLHPVVFVLFFITALAEANRAPFDLAECEQELVGGFHTEYSAMKWVLFFIGEYAHMFTSSALMVALFLGGWELFPFSTRLGEWLTGHGWPWFGGVLVWLTQNPSPWAALLRCGIFFGKIGFFIFMYMWVRWSLPRFRFDQLMRLAWKGMVPLALALVVLQAGLFFAFGGTDAAAQRYWVAPLGNVLLVMVCGLVSVGSRRPITGRQTGLPPAPSERWRIAGNGV